MIGFSGGFSDRSHITFVTKVSSGHLVCPTIHYIPLVNFHSFSPRRQFYTFLDNRRNRTRATSSSQLQTHLPLSPYFQCLLLLPGWGGPVLTHSQPLMHCFIPSLLSTTLLLPLRTFSIFSSIELFPLAYKYVINL